MSDNPGPRCAGCGRGEEEARALVTAGEVPLCRDCVRRYGDGLAALLEEESRRRGEVSQSAMAEELALNLMDALEASRSGGLPLPPPAEEPPAPAPPQAPPPKPVAVIPARYASTRLPAKPLALVAGKPLVQHVWERCVHSGAFAEVLVATDDERIAEAVRAFGGTAVMTSPHAKSGTDRIAEIARARPEVPYFVNVQGDEPLVHPEMLQALGGVFEDPEVEVATLVRPLEEGERQNPNVVKVVLSRNGRALYFSRADIPFERDPGQGFPHRFAHVGLYAYTREALLRLAQLAPSPLEDTERLEQLRALECGIAIRCLTTLHRTLGVDAPEDIPKVEAALAAEGSAAAAPEPAVPSAN